MRWWNNNGELKPKVQYEFGHSSIIFFCHLKKTYMWAETPAIGPHVKADEKLYFKFFMPELHILTEELIHHAASPKLHSVFMPLLMKK